jgi:hypothetical protein
MRPEAFVRFLAALWQQRGWETAVRERSGGTYVVRGRHPDGARGLLYVRPGVDGVVTAEVLDQFRRRAREQGVDVPVLATQGRLDQSAVDRAAETGVHLLDPSRIEAVVREGGFEQVLATFTDADGGEAGRGTQSEATAETAAAHTDGGTAAGGNDALAALGPVRAAVLAALSHLPGGAGLVGRLADVGRPAVPSRVAAAASRLPGFGRDEIPLDPLSPSLDGDEADGGDSSGSASRLRPALTRRSLGTVLLVVLVAVAGVLGAGTLAGNDSPVSLASGGGGDGGGVSAVSTAPPENATLHARWTARRADSVSLTDGTTYEPPAGETFLVVQLNVTNRGGAPATFGPSALALERDGARYGVQPLVGTDGGFAGGLFAPGSQRTVWVAFSVPAGAETGTLVVRHGSDAARDGISFEHDGSMTVSVVSS